MHIFFHQPSIGLSVGRISAIQDFLRLTSAIMGRQAAYFPPLQERGVQKEQEGHKKELSSVGKILKQKYKEREREGLGFQERHTVISKCFFALSGCLTKAAGEFD